MLWAISVLLGLLVIGLYLVHGRVIQLVGETEVINVHLASIAKETRSAESILTLIWQDSSNLRERSSKLDHLKDCD